MDLCCITRKKGHLQHYTNRGLSHSPSLRACLFSAKRLKSRSLISNAVDEVVRHDAGIRLKTRNLAMNSAPPSGRGRPRKAGTRTTYPIAVSVIPLLPRVRSRKQPVSTPIPHESFSVENLVEEIVLDKKPRRPKGRPFQAIMSVIDQKASRASPRRASRPDALRRHLHTDRKYETCGVFNLNTTWKI